MSSHINALCTLRSLLAQNNNELREANDKEKIEWRV